MQNLDQIRARNALRAALDPRKDFGGQEGGEVVKKVSPILLNHGFLAAAAYGLDDRQQKGWRSLFDAVAEHLADPAIGLLPQENANLEDMLRYLTSKEASSEQLRLVTNETMAWLNYARRLIRRKKEASR